MEGTNPLSALVLELYNLLYRLISNLSLQKYHFLHLQPYVAQTPSAHDIHGGVALVPHDFSVSQSYEVECAKASEQ
jgi:hypothetical protein